MVDYLLVEMEMGRIILQQIEGTNDNSARGISCTTVVYIDTAYIYSNVVVPDLFTCTSLPHFAKRGGLDSKK
jgi:formylmethanofuran dehydrogenase subunit D